MTTVVEYQYWVFKIRSIFAQKWLALKEIFVFFEMEACSIFGLLLGSYFTYWSYECLFWLEKLFPNILYNDIFAIVQSTFSDLLKDSNPLLKNT